MKNNHDQYPPQFHFGFLSIISLVNESLFLYGVLVTLVIATPNWSGLWVISCHIGVDYSEDRAEMEEVDPQGENGCEYMLDGIGFVPDLLMQNITSN